MSKKAYLLTLDALIAITIIVVGLALIFSQYSFEPYKPQTAFNSVDLMNLLASTKIYELNDDNYPDLSNCKNNGSITDFHNTLYEQAINFIEQGKIVMAQNFIKEIVIDSISNKYSYTISLKNSSHAFTLVNLTRHNSFSGLNNMQNSSLVIGSKRIISAVINTSSFVIYTGEVVVWQ